MTDRADGGEHETLNRQWHEIRLRLREELGDATFNSWLRPLDVVALDGGCVTMSVPTKFMREWVEQHYADRLHRCWADCEPSVRKVEILLTGSALPPVDHDVDFDTSARNGRNGLERPHWGRPSAPTSPAPTSSGSTSSGSKGAPSQALSGPCVAPERAGRSGGSQSYGRQDQGRNPVQQPVAPFQPSKPALHTPSQTPSVFPSNGGQGSSTSPLSPLDDDAEGPIEEKNTFDNFVVGKSNELAHAAARRVAESETVPFNPLFLYGGTGLGKTHLMHAMAWEVRRRYPQKRVIYLSAEKFMYQFVAAIRHHSQFAFKKQFRTVDLLMIDDFQYISGKENTQEEFFHTFNTLVDRSRQIVISADRSPSDLQDIEERIRSRLSWGLVADIHPTDFELRLSILQLKARQAAEIYGDVDIPQPVLDFLAHKITSNIRELEGALQKILAHAALVGRPVSVDVAQELLHPLIRANTRRVTVEEIQRKVAEHFSIKVADLLSPRRARVVTRPRQIAMYLAKQLTTRSLPDIGRRFGNRDHTTVMHAVKKVEELRRADPSIEQAVDTLRRLLEH
ncbi:MAG: chromosomal replication initiator protein DnaA [Alphaproteobacteria bacterium]